MWKNDNFFIGAIVSLTLIIATLIFLMVLIPVIYSRIEAVASVKVLLLTIVPSVLLMRYYFQKLKYTKAGSGALVIIFISVIAYFVFVQSNYSTFPTF